MGKLILKNSVRSWQTFLINIPKAFCLKKCTCNEVPKSLSWIFNLTNLKIPSINQLQPLKLNSETHLFFVISPQLKVKFSTIYIYFFVFLVKYELILINNFLILKYCQLNLKSIKPTIIHFLWNSWLLFLLHIKEINTNWNDLLTFFNIFI